MLDDFGRLVDVIDDTVQRVAVLDALTNVTAIVIEEEVWTGLKRSRFDEKVRKTNVHQAVVIEFVSDFLFATRNAIAKPMMNRLAFH